MESRPGFTCSATRPGPRAICVLYGYSFGQTESLPRGRFFTLGQLWRRVFPLWHKLEDGVRFAKPGFDRYELGRFAGWGGHRRETNQIVQDPPCSAGLLVGCAPVECGYG